MIVVSLLVGLAVFCLMSIEITEETTMVTTGGGCNPPESNFREMLVAFYRPGGEYKCADFRRARAGA